jgi:hypothetical protein
LAVEQDVYNLKRDCDEKETTIKELTNLLNSSEVANSKVISAFYSPELEIATSFSPFLTHLSFSLQFKTESFWIRRHYTEEEYNNFKTKEGFGCSGTKGTYIHGRYKQWNAPIGNLGA